MGVRKPESKLSEEEVITDVAMEDLDPLDSEPESESESDEDEDVRLAEPSKNAIYNKDGLLDKLGDISWPENVEWIHKLSVDVYQEQEVDVNDDLARELAFYTQALEGARQAFVKFETMGLPFLRPSDYYAEMVKSDSHMEKIKGRLLVEKKKIEEAEERKKARENKKKAKEVQAQKQRERAKQKKEEIESVKKWRKQREKSGFAGGDKDGDMGLPFEDGKPFERSDKKRPGVFPWDRSGGKVRQGAGKDRKGGDGKRKSRDKKDSKFGFGGRKGLKKQNTAESTNDLRGFNQGGCDVCSYGEDSGIVLEPVKEVRCVKDPLDEADDVKGAKEVGVEEPIVCVDEPFDGADEMKAEKEVGDEDELRRRVEEFIDMMNRGWKAEKLRDSRFLSSNRRSRFCVSRIKFSHG